MSLLTPAHAWAFTSQQPFYPGVLPVAPPPTAAAAQPTPGLLVPGAAAVTVPAGVAAVPATAGVAPAGSVLPADTVPTAPTVPAVPGLPASTLPTATIAAPGVLPGAAAAAASVVPVQSVMEAPRGPRDATVDPLPINGLGTVGGRRRLRATASSAPASPAPAVAAAAATGTAPALTLSVAGQCYSKKHALSSDLTECTAWCEGQKAAGEVAAADYLPAIYADKGARRAGAAITTGGWGAARHAAGAAGMACSSRGLPAVAAARCSQC